MDQKLMVPISFELKLIDWIHKTTSVVTHATHGANGGVYVNKMITDKIKYNKNKIFIKSIIIICIKNGNK